MQKFSHKVITPYIADKKENMRIIFIVWLLLSAFICVVSRVHIGIIFFDIDSISDYVNILPFSFFVDFCKKILLMLRFNLCIYFQEFIDSFSDFILNTVLFIPCGLSLYKIIADKNRVILYSFLIQFTYETIQLLLRLFHIGNAIFDVDDIIAALIGAGLGILTERLTKLIRSKK